MAVAGAVSGRALREVGLVYLVSALALGGVFIGLALRLGTGERRRAALVFHYSLLYLALLFTAAAIDAAL
jgi:heme O synthase-like polyprenyltransferase